MSKYLLKEKGVCIMENNELGRFLHHSYELMQNFQYGKRYYHTLTKEDNSPVVIREHTDQITYVVEGSGTIYLNGKDQNIKAGNLILIESGTTIRFIANSEKLTLFHIHIPDTGREDDRRILEGNDFDRYTIK
jgi:mannose-6-phosphate isomerase-like protein (cupin superfamily)